MAGKTATSVLLVMLVFAPGANAELTKAPRFSFNGFGTAGVVHSSEDQADFVGNIAAPDGAGHSASWSPEVDSRLGLQLTADLTRDLSAVTQVIIEQRYDDTYKPTLEWANVKYDITPDLAVRAGRVVLPTFLTSQYRKVGYAIPWVRPPQEVYRLLPISSNEGVDVSYRMRFSEVTNTFRANYGRKNSNTALTGEIKAREGLTLADTLEYGSAAFSASYSTARVTIPELNSLFDGFRQFGPAGMAIADRFDIDDSRLKIISLGSRYDPGDWFVMGEWARSKTDSALGDRTGWYVTGGYRFGSITPYVTLAGVRVDTEKSHSGLPVAGLPPPLAATATGLNKALNDFLGSGGEQHSLSVGARWDFARNLDLKVQFDYIDLKRNSPGTLVNEQPGFRRGGSVSVFSVALDFVF